METMVRSRTVRCARILMYAAVVVLLQTPALFANDQVTLGAPSANITSANQCVLLAVNLVKKALPPFSFPQNLEQLTVTLQLSDNLDLCDPASLDGTWAGAATSRIVTPLGNQQFRFADAVTTVPSGCSDNGGVVFYLNVKAAAGVGVAQGTVEIIDASSIECDNGTEPVDVVGTSQTININISTPAPEFDQVSFRGRFDDNSEIGATWQAGTNTNWTQGVDENFRVRFLVRESIGEPRAGLAFRLQRQYAGVWQSVSTSSSVVRTFDSPHFTDGEDTTQQIGGGGTYIFANQGMDDADGVAGNVAFSGGDEVELEYCIRILRNDVNDGEAVALRLVVEGGSAFTQYSNVPSITVDKPSAPTVPALRQAAFRGRNDDSSESLATWKTATNIHWNQAPDENFRVRFVVQEINDVGTNNRTFELEARLNAGEWQRVTNASSIARVAGSDNFTDGADTTRQIGLLDPLLFITPNQGMDDVDGVAGGDELDFDGGDEVELEYCVEIIPDDVVHGDVLELRVVSNSSALDQYANTPRIVVSIPSSDLVVRLVGPEPSEISCATPCVQLQVEMDWQTAVHPTVQGYSVRFRLTNLELCEAEEGTSNWRNSIGQGTWTFGAASHRQLTDLGQNEYQVDESILGTLSCNSSGGVLFSLDVRAAEAGEYLGDVEILQATVAECGSTNDLGPTVEALPGVSVSRPIPDVAAIDLIVGADVDWHAWQSRNFNTTDILAIPGCEHSCDDREQIVCAACGTSDVLLEFRNPGEGTFVADGPCWKVEIYRTRFENYPEYDDSATGAPGSEPANPGVHPPVAVEGGRWHLISQNASSPFLDQVDVPPTLTPGQRPSERDEWFYVAYLVDEFGNASGPSPVVSTLNYHLGDFVRPVDGAIFAPPTTEPLKGDNLVTSLDMSFFGACYGSSRPFSFVHPATGTPDCGICDVGPTVTGTNVTPRVPPVFGGRSVAKAHRPVTDGVIDANDLFVFSINFGMVSKPEDSPPLAAADALTVEAPAKVELGREFMANVLAQGAGNVQAMSITLTWDPSVVEPVVVGGRSHVGAGELLRIQQGIALSPRPGTVDVALLGKREVGLAGEGELATMLFRAVSEGEPLIGIGSIDARDPENQPVSLGTGRVNTSPATPRVTELYSGVPNPFNPSTTIAFSLAQGGQVELSIYSVSGRRVKTLFQGSRDAGMYEAQWNGRDEMGRAVPSGIYYARLTTANIMHTRSLVLVK